jgi:hypothetical protein
MVIGFATACMNRRWQLEKTLAGNLEVLADTRHVVALCDYNSADELGALVQGLSRFIRRGTLRYFHTTDPSSFHMSVAKNTAHRLAISAGADVVFNLDADNFISPDTIAAVERAFLDDPDTCLHNWDLDRTSGTCGRVALPASRWKELGGYDETLLPMGWQDVDLLYRARALGLRYRRLPDHAGTPVSNTFDDKLCNTRLSDFAASASAREIFNEMAVRNMVASLERPIRLPYTDQRRFNGTLNFCESVVV